ncbi:hypothetical protein FHG87_013160 [Trinorchestia longiramus]|nr:hypothetical protein FHG87_013160 [Trinorchestia longiramus]
MRPVFCIGSLLVQKDCVRVRNPAMNTSYFSFHAPRQPCRQRDSNPGLPARKQIRSPVDQAAVTAAPTTAVTTHDNSCNSSRSNNSNSGSNEANSSKSGSSKSNSSSSGSNEANSSKSGSNKSNSSNRNRTSSINSRANSNSAVYCGKKLHLTGRGYPCYHSLQALASIPCRHWLAFPAGRFSRRSLALVSCCEPMRARCNRKTATIGLPQKRAAVPHNMENVRDYTPCWKGQVASETSGSKRTKWGQASEVEASEPSGGKQTRTESMRHIILGQTSVTAVSTAEDRPPSVRGSVTAEGGHRSNTSQNLRIPRHSHASGTTNRTPPFFLPCEESESLK